MNESWSLLLALATGNFLGVVFFGGLWWTVQKGLPSKRSVLWFFVSMTLRTSVVLAGFYFIERGHWERLPVCLLGFVVARVVVMRLTRVCEKPAVLPQEAGHAS